jgi:hypothetical protein
MKGASITVNGKIILDGGDLDAQVTSTGGFFTTGSNGSISTGSGSPAADLHHRG